MIVKIEEIPCLRETMKAKEWEGRVVSMYNFPKWKIYQAQLCDRSMTICPKHDYKYWVYLHVSARNYLHVSARNYTRCTLVGVS